MHRADVAIVFNICLILLYLFLHQNHDFAEKPINSKMVFLILLCLIITPARNFYVDRDRVSETDIANNKIFYANTTDMLNEVLKYIEKKSGKPVNAVCVKKFLGKSIYRVNSKDITDVYEFTDVTEETADVNENLQIKIKKGRLKVSGSVYIEGKNDFYQNVYIDVVDSQSNKHQLFYTLQTLNEEFEEENSGWCSNISAKIDLPEFYDKNDEIYLMIETLDATYKYRISR